MGFRKAYPEYYKATKPPEKPVRLPGEFEPVKTVFYAWEAGYENFYCSLTQRIVEEADVKVVLLFHGEEERADICSCLHQVGDLPLDMVVMLDVARVGPYYHWRENPQIYEEYAFDPDHPPSLGSVEDPHERRSREGPSWSNDWPWDRSLDSDWVRDWGPFFIETPGADPGSHGVVDFRYDAFRVNDDAVPSKLAALYDLPVYRSSLDMDGGNLVTDGLGTCFVAWSPEDLMDLPPRVIIERELGLYLGCHKIVWLRSLENEPTGHVDIFVKMASPNLILVRKYSFEDDPKNAAILDYDAEVIASETNGRGEPFEVLRVPMPDNRDGVFRTYLNSLLLNDIVIVPTYRADRLYEDRALSLYSAVFSERDILPIEAGPMVERGGAVRCATNTWPAPPGALRTLLEMGWNPVEWPDVEMTLPRACR